MVIFKIILLLLVYTIPFFGWNLGAAAASRNVTNGEGGQRYIQVHIGVVLDLNSTLGTMADVCISMALEDFYSVHPDHQTRIVLRYKDARGELDVVSQVLELMTSEDVHGILGLETLKEDTPAAELGRKAQVPLISFTSRPQSFTYPKNAYFIRTTPDNSNQVKALTTICKGFEWHEVVILYEDTDYGNQFTSELNRELLREDIHFARMIPISASASDFHINKELENVRNIQTRVCIVHMNSMLGIRLFDLARRAEMMSEGYAWIVTDSLGNSLNSIDSAAFDSIEGVLGIRPHVPKSKERESFQERWKKNMILTKSVSTKAELNAYGLWAYDAVWALAMAVEKTRPTNSSLLKSKNGENTSDIFNLSISQFGPKLINELYSTNFVGLSGEFKLIDGQLKSSALEIFNVRGTGDKLVGYWTPDGGITRDLGSFANKLYSTSTKELKLIVWPGDSAKKPLGWSIPPMGKLRVVVPKKSGFTEFVNVTIDPVTNKTNEPPTGFCLDIFTSILQYLPFEVDPEFQAFDANGSTGYEDLTHCLLNKTCDMVVGDVTILEYRARNVDFSLPYSESGVVWVVKNKQEKNMWIFVQPFRWDLWVTILATCIFVGVVLRILEHLALLHSDSSSPDRQQLGVLFWFPIAALAFPERNMVANNWSRFVLVVWLFMAYILMQSYTANLSAMFTVDQLDFTFSQDYYIGHQQGTFVKKFLMEHHNISGGKLRNYSSVEGYHDAMMKGGKNGGIDAIVDEIPYMKLFLSRYGSRYKMLGIRYRTEGFAFVFPRNSPLTSYFSRAILNVTESSNMTTIQEKNFGPGYNSQNQLESNINKQNSLTTYNFGGLFIIVGSAMIFALFCSMYPVRQKLIDLARICSLKCFSFLPFISISMVHPDDYAGKYSSSEPQVQITGNDSVIGSDMDHQSGQGNSVFLAEVNESGSNETQQPQPRNAEIPAR